MERANQKKASRQPGLLAAKRAKEYRLACGRKILPKKQGCPADETHLSSVSAAENTLTKAPVTRTTVERYRTELGRTVPIGPSEWFQSGVQLKVSQPREQRLCSADSMYPVSGFSTHPCGATRQDRKRALLSSLVLVQTSDYRTDWVHCRTCTLQSRSLVD